MTDANILMDRYSSLFPTRYSGPAHFFGFTVADGWLPIIERMLDQLAATDVPMSIVQIKEKFGGLRVYFKARPDVAGPIVEEAQIRCAHCCEVCGDPGKIEDIDGMFKAVCPRHHEELRKQRSNRKSRGF